MGQAWHLHGFYKGFARTNPKIVPAKPMFVPAKPMLVPAKPMRVLSKPIAFARTFMGFDGTLHGFWRNLAWVLNLFYICFTSVLHLFWWEMSCQVAKNPCNNYMGHTWDLHVFFLLGSGRQNEMALSFYVSLFRYENEIWNISTILSWYTSSES